MFIDASEALKFDPENKKATYRKGVALAEFGCYQKARECFDAVLSDFPNDKNTRSALETIKDKVEYIFIWLFINKVS